MMDLMIHQIKLTIGIRDLLNIKNLQVRSGQKIGIIGRNGCGKSTLLKILVNQQRADIANFSLSGMIRLLPQLKETNDHRSGGEVSQDYLVHVLNQSPKILLLDEPTTNLDASHVEWVEKQLKNYHGSLLLVSHDRKLLDEVIDTIWELKDGKIEEYTGNYSDYLIQKEIQQKHHQKEYDKYKRHKRELEQALDYKNRQAAQSIKKPKQLSNSEARMKGAKPYFAKLQKGLHQNAKAIEKRLERLEEVEIPKEEIPIKMSLPNTRSFINQIIIRAQNIKGEVPGKTLWNKTTFHLKGGDKVGIIGPNGSGKTTFLKQVLADDKISLKVSPSVKIGYFAQNLKNLDENKSILENVKEGSIQSETLIRTVLARLGFLGTDVNKQIHVLSGGERVKVSLAKIFVSDCNTLILDEPTNFLDLYAMEALEKLLQNYDGTILFVSHDRQFISSIATKILAIENQKMTFYDGTYKEFKKHSEAEERDTDAEKLMTIEMAITTVLSKLSDPLLPEENKEKLDKKFQELLKKKKQLE